MLGVYFQRLTSCSCRVPCLPRWWPACECSQLLLQPAVLLLQPGHFLLQSTVVGQFWKI